MTRFIPIVLLFVLAGCHQDHSSIDQISSQYTAANYLKIKGSFCDIEVVPSESAEVSIEGEISGYSKPGSYRFMEKLKDSTLKIWIDEPVAKIGTVTGKLKIRTPHQTRLKITNESGDVYISGLTTKKLKVRTSSGDVVVQECKAYLQVKTLSGDIRVNELKGPIKASSSSGDQQFIDAKGDINTVATSGDVNLSETGGQYTIVSTSGDIKGEAVRLKGNSNFKTISGDIKMRFRNPVEELAFQLSSTTGEIRCGPDVAEKHFNKTGEIVITGTTDSGDQTYQN